MIASAAFPFESKFVDVLDSNMHYVDVGEGDPILFLHGNPTSSYLWRNVIPHLTGQGRCIAVDLIGMGKSEHPDIGYRFDDHYRYLSAFIESLGINSDLTLVIHDWGSALGFRWAHEHEGSVKAIAFMDAMIRTMSLNDMPGSLKMAFRMMRAPFIGWLMISVANIFIKKMLPDLTHAKLSPEVLEFYGSAYPTIASRKAIRQWPSEVPLDGSPADNVSVVEAYREWLTRTKLPKLLFHSNGGIAIQAPQVAWCRENLPNLDVVDLGEGIHFVQETHPETIGSELSKWYAKLNAREPKAIPKP
jgi:haloalkane dehalogenase